MVIVCDGGGGGIGDGDGLTRCHEEETEETKDNTESGSHHESAKETGSGNDTAGQHKGPCGVLEAEDDEENA